MKITAVVVTYNRCELLKKGIESLRRQKRLEEIIVVNNGSIDGTADWLSCQSDLKVITQENVGGSGGFYTGIKAAYDDGADWIWCMDDDVFPRPDSLDHLLDEAQKYSYEQIGILSPRRIMDDKVFTHEFRRYDFSNPVGSMHAMKLTGDETKPTEIVGCDFEGPLISRAVVSKIGLPNKDLFIFCDDTDYCLRAHLAGFTLVYVPDAVMDKHKFFSGDSWTERNRKKKVETLLSGAKRSLYESSLRAELGCALSTFVDRCDGVCCSGHNHNAFHPRMATERPHDASPRVLRRN